MASMTLELDEIAPGTKLHLTFGDRAIYRSGLAQMTVNKHVLDEGQALACLDLLTVREPGMTAEDVRTRTLAWVRRMNDAADEAEAHATGNYRPDPYAEAMAWRAAQ